MPIYNYYGHDAYDGYDDYDDVSYSVGRVGLLYVAEPQPQPSFHCQDCNRTFLNENNLREHRRSHTHLGSQLTCPFCKRNYTTATGVTHHLERGSCPKAPQLNREQIFNIMKQRDPNGFVTNRLLQYDNTTTTASQQAWNGQAFQCYFCGRQFRALKSLNSHLQSPIHQQALYHCPNCRCGKQFTTLAATINHLESERCGFMTFSQVQTTMGDIVSSNRRLAF